MHTPGPWKCSGGGGVSSCMESETLKSGRRIARRTACAKGISIEEVTANARLIAAAPDLLAALQEIANLPNTPSDELATACNLARGAIFKAMGST